jgi:tetratricopeptide (TPR) repeat protein
LFADWAYVPLERRKRDYVWATVCFALALLSKPAAASIPAVVVIIDLVLLRRPWRETLRWTALWFVMAAGITGLTKYYQRTNIIYVESVRPWTERPFVAGDAYAFYLGKLAWPAELAFDEGRTPHYVVTTPTFYYAWLLPVGVGLVLACLPRRRIWLGCYAIFLATIAPVSGLMPFLYQSISTVADRYMYVPFVGFALMGAAWIATRRNPLLPTVALGLLLGLAARGSYEQTETWRDDWTVFHQGLKVTPRSFMAHLHLGMKLEKEQRYAAAVSHYRRMLAIRPDYFTTHYRMAVCLHELGHVDAAIDELQLALVDRSYVDAWCLLGRCRLEQGDWDQARACYQEAAEMGRKATEPLLLLGEAFAEHKRFGEAEREFRRAVERDERSADVHVRYGRMLVAAGRNEDAQREFEQAVEIDPQFHAANVELAEAYSREKRFDRAVDVATQAVSLKPDDFASRKLLGEVQCAAGQTSDAIETWEHALALVPPASPQAAEVRQRLGALRAP